MIFDCVYHLYISYALKKGLFSILSSSAKKEFVTPPMITFHLMDTTLYFARIIIFLCQCGFGRVARTDHGAIEVDSRPEACTVAAR